MRQTNKIAKIVNGKVEKVLSGHNFAYNSEGLLFTHSGFKGAKLHPLLNAEGNQVRIGENDNSQCVDLYDLNACEKAGFKIVRNSFFDPDEEDQKMSTHIEIRDANNNLLNAFDRKGMA